MKTRRYYKIRRPTALKVKNATVADYVDGIKELPNESSMAYYRSVKLLLADLYDTAQYDYKESLISKLFDVEE